MNNQSEKLFDRIRGLLAKDLGRFDARFADVLERQKELLSEKELALYTKGKKIRPILLLLSTRLNTSKPQIELDEKVIAAAVSLEIAHIGSLIHDDIVDNASMRRGLPTFNASRGYEFALLIGDLQLMESARVFSSFVSTVDDIKLMQEYLDTGYELCKGQIEELVNETSEWDPKKISQRYYRIIDRKTGPLISFACEAGARLADALPSQVKAMRKFGMFLGRAFQIMDDVMDILSPTHKAGKEIFTDLRERRLSLPVIYALDTAPKTHAIHRVINGEQVSESDFEKACEFIKSSNSHIKAYNNARISVEEAKTELYQYKNNEYKQALFDLCDFVVDRGYQ